MGLRLKRRIVNQRTTRSCGGRILLVVVTSSTQMLSGLKGHLVHLSHLLPAFFFMARSIFNAAHTHFQLLPPMTVFLSWQSTATFLNFTRCSPASPPCFSIDFLLLTPKNLPCGRLDGSNMVQAPTVLDNSSAQFRCSRSRTSSCDDCHGLVIPGVTKDIFFSGYRPVAPPVRLCELNYPSQIGRAHV